MSDVDYDLGVGLTMLEESRLREASYDLGDGRSVYFDDGKESLRDAADLYAVLEELHGTGSPNLENMQARYILDRMQQGGGLGEVHLNTLRDLTAKHAAKIAALRRTPDRRGQDMLHVATAGPEGRIHDPAGKRRSER